MGHSAARVFCICARPLERIDRCAVPPGIELRRTSAHAASIMAAFYLTALAVLLSGIAARDQMIVAALTQAQGQRLGVLITGLLCAAIACVIAVYAATAFLALLPAPARPILAAFAIGLAGLESLIFSPRRKVKEPTHSLGALGLVLLAKQVTDATRFTVFALAVGTGAPLAAGLGGGLASFALIASAWAFSPVFATTAIRVARRLVGAVMLVIAIGMYLSSQGLL